MRNINVFKLLEYGLGPRTAAVLLITDSGVAHAPDVRRLLPGDTSRALLWIEIQRLKKLGLVETSEGRGKANNIAVTKKGKAVVKDLRR